MGREGSFELMGLFEVQYILPRLLTTVPVLSYKCQGVRVENLTPCFPQTPFSWLLGATATYSILHYKLELGYKLTIWPTLLHG